MWIFNEPSFWAIIISVSISVFTFLFRWVEEVFGLELTYGMRPYGAPILAGLGVFFAILALVSLVFFIRAILIKRRRDIDTPSRFDDFAELRKDIKDIKELLQSERPAKDENEK